MHNGAVTDDLSTRKPFLAERGDDLRRTLGLLVAPDLYLTLQACVLIRPMDPETDSLQPHGLWRSRCNALCKYAELRVVSRKDLDLGAQGLRRKSAIPPDPDRPLRTVARHDPA